jgi:SAM-dependent methyltransferase
MQFPDAAPRPSLWVARHAGLMAKPGPVLDLAAGSGRHSRYLLDLGYRVTAVDRDVSRLADLPGAEIVAADLEGAPWPLAGRIFAGIVVTNYLFRPILPRIAAALGPGGILIYETFGIGHERYGKPRNSEHLLQPGELLDLAESAGLTALAYFCGEVAAPDPAVRQGIVAQRAQA